MCDHALYLYDRALKMDHTACDGEHAHFLAPVSSMRRALAGISLEQTARAGFVRLARDDDSVHHVADSQC